MAGVRSRAFSAKSFSARKRVPASTVKKMLSFRAYHIWRANESSALTDQPGQIPSCSASETDMRWRINTQQALSFPAIRSNPPVNEHDRGGTQSTEHDLKGKLF